MLKHIYRSIVLSIFFFTNVSAEVQNSVIPNLGITLENLYGGKISEEYLKKLEVKVDKANPRIRVMSFNMLFNLPFSEQELAPEHRWPNRMPRLVEYILYSQADVIGSQELQIDQIEDLMKDIGDVYDYYGVGRNDGETAGEIEAIFYRKDRFELIENNTYWFSETPNACSKNKHGKINAITSVTLCDRETGKKFHVLNVHLSFKNINSRYYEALFLQKHLKNFPKKERVILTGDFNSFPLRLDIPDYPFYDGDKLVQMITKYSVREARSTSYFGHIGPLNTSAFTIEKGAFSEAHHDSYLLLDHIFVMGPVTVMIHAIDKAKVNGHFPSDHHPVITEVILR